MSRGRVSTAIWEALPEPVRIQMRSRRAEFRGLGQVKMNQALLAKKLAELEMQPVGAHALGRCPLGATLSRARRDAVRVRG